MGLEHMQHPNSIKHLRAPHRWRVLLRTAEDARLSPLLSPDMNDLHSSSRRSTRPRSTLPPPRTHLRNSTGTASQSPALILRRSVLAPSCPAPRLKVKSMMLASRSADSWTSAGHRHQY